MAIVKDMLHLRARADEQFYAQLERSAAEKEKVHRLALASAAAAHDDVLRSAELVRLRFEHELQKEIRRRQEEERKEFERIRREKAEAELAERRQRIEDAHRAERAEAERIRQIEELEAEARARSTASAEADKRAQQQRRQSAEEAARRNQEQAQRAQQQAKVAAPVAAAPQPPPPPAAAPAGVASVIDPEELQRRDANHRRMVEMHQQLKVLRNNTLGWAKTSPNWKTKLGDMRREIRKSVGQLTEGRGANKEPVRKIGEILKEAMADGSAPQVDIRTYIFDSNQVDPNSPSANQAPEAPATFVYLLNIFAKAVMAQFIDEAGVAPKAADPVGIVVAQIFATPQFHWRGMPLIDILMCKFHVVCPVLWGIFGNEKTNLGKTRLGWWREEKDGPWVSDQRHSERMTGLGAGFASIALRNFEKSKSQNPYPNYHYWQSLQYIISLPPQAATWTHYIVLKSMIEHYETRFLDFFGAAALAALRKALIEFPKQAPTKNAAASALGVLTDVMKRDAKLTI
ncbi:MAG: hypothetical protein M4579_002619 [Chaenotheca gracillima]|nr:MAG: hypothetical protein M4579_002619 [Chaenotheca gracillima]